MNLIILPRRCVGQWPLRGLFLLGLLLPGIIGQPGELQAVEFLERTRLTKELYDAVSDIPSANSAGSLNPMLELTGYLNLTDVINKELYVNAGISTECADDALQYAYALSRGELWAVRMFDATGKIGSGVLDGNVYWLGSYDQCFASFSGSNVSTQVDFEPNYCLASAKIMKTTYVHVGVCLPRVCSNSDALALLKSVLPLLPDVVRKDVSLTSVNCKQELDIWQDQRAIIVIACYSLLGALILVGTLYDVILTMIKSWRQVDTPADDLLVKSFSKENQLPTEATSLIRNGAFSCDKGIPERPGMCGRLLLSFSVYTNSSKLLSTSQAAGTLTSLHGVRFLSMTWVILGHTFVMAISHPVNGLAAYETWIQRWTFQAIMQGTFSVDSFFLLSGTLVAYLTLTEMAKVNGRINWIYYYIHRVWRLTPTYMLILGLYVAVFTYMGDGPVWPGAEEWTDGNNCEKVWWTNLLYLNNLISIDKMCMGWTWYLANDMQFYVISPILLLLLFFFPMVGAVLILAIMAATFSASAVLTRQEDLGPGIFSKTGGIVAKYFQDMYIKPWCRIGPYLVGVLLGYVMYRTKCRLRINRFLVMLLWCVAAVLCLAPLYGLYDHTNGYLLSLGMAALYNAVARTSWAVGLAWLLFACCTGYGGIINTLLSWKAMIPLSRLTYCAYLVHPIIMYAIERRSRQPFYISNANMICHFLSFLVLSYAVGFVASLAFESPMVALEKTIRMRTTGTKPDT